MFYTGEAIEDDSDDDDSEVRNSTKYEFEMVFNFFKNYFTDFTWSILDYSVLTVTMGRRIS